MRATGVCVIHAMAVMGVLWAARGGEAPAAKPLVLHVRLREAAPAQRAGFTVKEKILEWELANTALVICDMWDQHWCKGATRRVGELAPAMNRAVKAACDRGVLIIHAPSSCMDVYENHLARKRAQAAPKAANLPADIDGWCTKVPAE